MLPQISCSEPETCEWFAAGASQRTGNKPRRSGGRGTKRHQVRKMRSRRAGGRHNWVPRTTEGRGPPATPGASFGGQGRLSDSAPLAPELSAAGWCGKRSSQAEKRKVSLPEQQRERLFVAAEDLARDSLRPLRPSGANAFFVSRHSRTETDVVRKTVRRSMAEARRSKQARCHSKPCFFILRQRVALLTPRRRAASTLRPPLSRRAASRI